MVVGQKFNGSLIMLQLACMVKNKQFNFICHNEDFLFQYNLYDSCNRLVWKSLWEMQISYVHSLLTLYQTTRFETCPN